MSLHPPPSHTHLHSHPPQLLFLHLSTQDGQEHRLGEPNIAASMPCFLSLGTLSAASAFICDLSSLKVQLHYGICCTMTAVILLINIYAPY